MSDQTRVAVRGCPDWPSDRGPRGAYFDDGWHGCCQRHRSATSSRCRAPTEDRLVAAGRIDRSSEKGPQAWRMIKNNVAGFSIGFMAKDRPLPDGGRELYEIDLLEVSITSTPRNAATRALSLRSAADRSALAELEEILGTWRRIDAMWRDGLLETELARKSVSTAPIRVERFEVE